VALTGTVASDAGARIAGATVTALDGVNAGRTTTTDSSGVFHFDGLTFGNDNFSATATGFFDDRRGITVDGTATINFVLRTPPPPPPPTPVVVPTLGITTRIISGGFGSATQEWGFSANPSDKSFTTFDWDFGDGSTAGGSGPDEQHVYRRKATFTVTVVGHRKDNPTTVTATLDVTIQ
jgi:hypothetical protein